MITVMGATGRIGGRITHQLRKGGHAVRALGRSEAKLADLGKAGAEVRAGDAADPSFLTRAFQGADAVFTLLPYDPDQPGYLARQDRQGEAIVEAIRASGVPYVVALSSVGADQPSGTGLIVSLHAQEQRLRTLDGTNVLVLRPGSFFENFHGALEGIRQQGIHADAVFPDLAVPMIATRDIADAAARALLGRDWTGVTVRELLGPRDLGYAEATRIFGQHLGRPDLQYVQVPYGDMVQALVRAGFAEDVASLHAELARGINEGRIHSVEGRTAANTTPTRFEDFAAELARVYPAA